MLGSMPSPDPTTDIPIEPWRQAMVPPEAAAGDLAFVCPRCCLEVQEATYGPCPTCRAQLRATLGGDARTAVEEQYVPKVNVTPNAVATKD